MARPLERQLGNPLRKHPLPPAHVDDSRRSLLPMHDIVRNEVKRNGKRRNQQQRADIRDHTQPDQSLMLHRLVIGHKRAPHERAVLAPCGVMRRRGLLCTQTIGSKGSKANLLIGLG